MYRTTHRIRKAGVAALAAALAISGLVFAPSAGAITSGSTLVAQSVPNAGIGKTGQAAGNWKLTPTTATETWASGEQVTIAVDDSGGGNCVAAGDTIGFSAVPTVSVTGTATVVATVEESAACVTLGGTAVNDVLRLNFIGTGTGTLTISGVQYNIGSAAAPGLVAVTGTDSAGGAVTTGPGASNAFLTSTILTANNPPKGAVRTSGGTQTISPLVIAEQTTTGGDADLCIELAGVNVMNTPLVQPTVAVSGGSDTATITAVDSDTLFLNVTASTPTATTSTFTISGIVLDTDNFGFTTATAFVDTSVGCDGANGAQLSVATNAGYVGDVDRYGGSDRFVTAQILFEKEFECSDDVIIARADLYPDALAASYLAGDFGMGILLTNTNSVPASTLNALRNEGVDNVYLMGGTTAISAAVATQLDGTTASSNCGPPDNPTLTVERIGGVDRYETAQMISEYPGLDEAGYLDITPTVTTDSEERTAIVASGENFPDALAAGPLAYSGYGDNPVPLLLTRQSAVPASTLGALGDLGIVNVIVTGGTVAVSDAAVAQLTAAGYNVRRIAGTTRQGTAVALATAMIKEWGFDTNGASLARGDLFPDSLTGGPVSGNSNEVILLTGSPTSLSAETAGVLRAWRATFADTALFFEVFGGTSAISAGVVQELVNAASQQ